MTSQPASEDLKMRIKKIIEAAYLERGWEVFVPHQFVDLKLGSEPEVMSSLKQLERAGNLRTEVLVRCGAGHDIFQGEQDEALRWLRRGCVREGCETLSGDAEDMKGQAFLRFSISEVWRDFIDAKKKAAMERKH